MKQYTESLIEDYVTDEVNTEDFIAYPELEKYFNKYYFDNGRTTLLPPADDKEGWDTLHNLANIEQGIYKGDKTASGLARICIFYNNYVIEHWLLDNNVFKFETNFIPDDKYKDNDDYTVLPSHEYLRRCNGESIPDFEYIGPSGNNVKLDIKTLKASERKPEASIINTPAHNAKYVAGYNPENNTLTLYKQLKDNLYLKYQKQATGETFGERNWA